MGVSPYCGGGLSPSATQFTSIAEHLAEVLISDPEQMENDNIDTAKPDFLLAFRKYAGRYAEYPASFGGCVTMIVN
jgi:hypothetical protein